MWPEDAYDEPKNIATLLYGVQVLFLRYALFMF